MLNYESASSKALASIHGRLSRSTDLVEQEAVSITHTTIKTIGTMEKPILQSSIMASVEGSGDKIYQVAIMATCECYDARNGFVCKHIQATLQAYNLGFYNQLEAQE